MLWKFLIYKSKKKIGKEKQTPELSGCPQTSKQNKKERKKKPYQNLLFFFFLWGLALCSMLHFMVYQFFISVLSQINIHFQQSLL